ncbi:hypothetical protein V2J09_018790 [Rumex salicifolius]
MGKQTMSFTFFLIVLISVSPSSTTAQSPVYACDVASNASMASLGFCNTKLGVKARVSDLVKRLTLEEKVKFLVSGASPVPRLGLPKYEWWSEALHGVSYVGPGTRFTSVIPGATSFPQVITTAASFNTTLFEAIGKVVSTEARAMYNVGLAGLTFWSPNVNIFRDPRWGRGQETPGEDPLLSGKYASGYVRGLQLSDDGDPNKLKVASCCKHYTAYDLDSWKGVDRFHFNALVSQQDLDDTFQPPFKSCVVEGKVASVMCSYNQVNGKPTCADSDLLKGVVRGKWNLNGYIVTDCVDLNCGSFLAQHTEAAVKSGLLKETAVNNAISNNFATLMRLGFFDGSPKKSLYGYLGPKDVCTPAHQELALEAARQGIVLLKNAGNSVLPFSPTAVKSLAVIGPNANVTKTMIGNYEGTPCKYTTPLQGLSSYTSTAYLPGCTNVACMSAQVSDAAKLASNSDATVLVMGIDQSIEAEGRDRVDLLLPGQQQLLINAVANASRGLVVLVIMSGGGFDISFAKNSDKIGAILWVGYPGQAGGAALADIIFGGRLPMTWYPQSYVDKIPMTNMNMRPNPSMGYPGRTYRFYTGETIYTFGDGLSYSTFNHHLVHAPDKWVVPLAQDHHCRASKCKSLDVLEEGVCQSYAFDIHMKVRNDGAMRGSHTIFLYYKPPRVHNAPVKHLVGFEKVNLGAKEEALLKFHVDGCKDLSLVDEVGNRKIALGLHKLQIGDLEHSLLVRI